MEIILKKHELLDLGPRHRDLTVACQAGSCWLTQAGDSRDYILHAGKSIQIQSSGQVVISAHQDSRLQLLSETADDVSGLLAAASLQ